MHDLEINDMRVSREAINKLVVMAVRDVEGVCVQESAKNSGILEMFSKPDDVITDIALDDEKLRLGVHLNVKYSNPLPEIAEKVRMAVANTVSTQLGLDVVCVDVYVDGVQFDK